MFCLYCSEWTISICYYSVDDNSVVVAAFYNHNYYYNDYIYYTMFSCTIISCTWYKKPIEFDSYSMHDIPINATETPNQAVVKNAHTYHFTMQVRNLYL